LIKKKAFSFSEQKRIAHSLSLKRQGVWLQWSENTIPFDFSWQNLIWSSNTKLISFVLNATVNWVRTPDLLQLWGLKHLLVANFAPQRNAPSIINYLIVLLLSNRKDIHRGMTLFFAI